MNTIDTVVAIGTLGLAAAFAVFELRAKIRALRLENQELRRELAEAWASASASPSPSVSASPSWWSFSRSPSQSASPSEGDS